MSKKIESPTPDPASEAAKARGSQLLAEGKTVAERAHGAMLKLIAWHKRSREFSGPTSKHPELIPYIRMLELRGTFPADVEQYLRDTYGAAITPGIPAHTNYWSQRNTKPNRPSFGEAPSSRCTHNNIQ